MLPIRSGFWCAFGPAAGLAVLVVATSCSRPADAGPAGPLHGAAPADEQLRALERLGIGTSVTTPRGIDAAQFAAITPKDNALSPERIELGRKLYFETRLSRDNTVSCATCHDVTRSFTDRRATSEGIGGQLGQRNAPTSLNAALLGSQFWDGRAATVEDQAKLPIVNPVEMGMPDGDAAVAAIASDAEYQRMFKAAYGNAVNFDDLGRAIGAFERTLIFLEAPADRYLAGEAGAIDAAAQRGWILYNGKARCAACHPLSPANPIGTDNRFHNIGVSARKRHFVQLAAKALAELGRDPSLANVDKLALATELSELGRFLISKNYSDIGSFRTPLVRNTGITAPYMHDGSIATLWDVIDHYNRGGEANPYLDGGMEPLGLSEAEIDDLVAFLFTLTDRRFADLNGRELARQRALARDQRPLRDDDLALRKKLSFDPRK